MVVTLQVYVSCIKSRSGLIINLSTAVADHHRLGEFTARLHHHCYIIINIIIILNCHHSCKQHPHPQGQLSLLKDSKKSSLQKSQECHVCNRFNSPPASVWVVPILSSCSWIFSAWMHFFSTGLILFIPACCECLNFYKLIINIMFKTWRWLWFTLWYDDQWGPCFESQWWRCVSYSDCGLPSLRFQLIGREGLTHSTLELSDFTQLIFWNFQIRLCSRSESKTLLNCLDLNFSDHNQAESQYFKTRLKSRLKTFSLQLTAWTWDFQTALNSRI